MSSKKRTGKSETEALRDLCTQIAPGIASVIDAHASTNRFIQSYQELFEGRRILLLDSTNRGLTAARHRFGNEGENVSFLKHDFLKKMLHTEADIVLCFGWLNQLSWGLAKAALHRLLIAAKSHVLIGIRFENQQPDPGSTAGLEATAYLHDKDDFVSLIASSEFTLETDLPLQAVGGGDDHVYLLTKSVHFAASRVNKNYNIVFEREGTGVAQPKKRQPKKSKTYQCFGEQHANFIASLSRSAAASGMFPAVLASNDEFVTAEWVEAQGHATDPSRLVALLRRLHEIRSELDSGFDYVKDFVLRRFRKAIPLIGKKCFQETIDHVLRFEANYPWRVSNPDVAPSNVIVDEYGNTVIIDNELLCRTRFHRADILNLLASLRVEDRERTLGLYLRAEDLSPEEFEQEFEFFISLWFAREMGSRLVDGDLRSCRWLLSRYRNGDWILPFDWTGFGEWPG